MIRCMNYGQSRPSTRSRRQPHYDWTPSYTPARRKRRRKGARPYRRRTSDLDLSDHFCRPWLHDWEPENWDGRTYQERRIDNDLILCAAEAIVFLFWKFLVLAGLAVVAWLFLLKMIRKFRGEINIQGEASRKALRLGRRVSIHAPPTPERLRKAWAESRDSLEGKLLLGSLLSDIEPVVDRSYIRSEDGTIIGRQPGIKGWLSLNCPDLLPHYKALMSYKALADKVRLALGISDPDSLEEALAAAKRMMQGDHVDQDGESNPKDANEKPLDSRETLQGGNPKPQIDGRIEPKSMAEISGFKTLNEKTLEHGKALQEMIDGLARPTMVALEAAAREKLGITWMVRGRPRRLAS